MVELAASVEQDDEAVVVVVGKEAVRGEEAVEEKW